jgi:putative spermidine/putrescine transport system substrate-binding protein
MVQTREEAMSMKLRWPSALVVALVIGTLLRFAVTPASAASNEIVFGGFGGSFEKAMKETVIPMFEKKYNAKVIYVAGTSAQLNAKLLANRANPGIDVIWGTDASYYSGKKAGLFAKLHTSKVPNLADLYPFAVYKDDIGVMMGIQACGIEYNKKVFTDKGWAPPTSWNDLWDPKYKGHVVSYNLPIGYASVFFSVVAQLTHAKAPDFAAAWPKISALVPNVLTFVNPPAQVDALFATGGAWIGYNGSARIGELAKRGVPVALASPKEGAVLNPNQFVIVKKGPNPDLANKFINLALSVEAQEQIAKTMLLGPVNRKVKLDAAAAAKVPYGDAVKKLWIINQDPINANMKQLVEHWTKVVSKR